MQISPVKFPQLPVFSNKATEDEFLPLVSFRRKRLCVEPLILEDRRNSDLIVLQAVENSILNSESLDKVASVSGAGNQQARQELSERTFSKSN